MQMARHHKRPNQQGGKKKNTFGGWRAARQVKAFIQFTGYISTTFNARSVVAFRFGNGEVAAFSLVAHDN